MPTTQITLTTSQITELNQKSNFPDAYRYIFGLIKDNPNVNEGTKYWFKQASEINANNPNNSANKFIRSVTTNGFNYDGIMVLLQCSYDLILVYINIFL